MHGLAILGAVEVAGRKLGAKGRFGFFKTIPWGEPGMAALMVSMALFALGGWSGTVATTAQLNMLTHNNIWVPAHLHGVVVGGMTLSFMGLSYYLVPLLARRQLFSQGMARVQPYLYGVGLFIMMVTMNWAGFLGVPRRAPDITYAGASPDWFLPMNLLGIGIALAVLGGLFYVLNMVLTLVHGKKFQ